MSRKRFERRLAVRRKTDRAVAEWEEMRTTLGQTLQALEVLRDAWAQAGRPGPDAARIEALVDKRQAEARALLERTRREPPDRPPGAG